MNVRPEEGRATDDPDERFWLGPGPLADRTRPGIVLACALPVHPLKRLSVEVRWLVFATLTARSTSLSRFLTATARTSFPLRKPAQRSVAERAGPWRWVGVEGGLRRCWTGPDGPGTCLLHVCRPSSCARSGSSPRNLLYAKSTVDAPILGGKRLCTPVWGGSV